MAYKTNPREGLILSLNSGSSSLKISLYRLSDSSASTKPDPNDPTINPIELIFTSSITSITTSPTFSFSSSSSSDVRTAKNEPLQGSVKDHASAFAHFLEYMKKEADIDRESIAHVCHRIVHGGDYSEPVIINNESYHHIEALTDLAPLHNGAALSVIKASIDELKHANNIAYFDTTFHQEIPAYISSYVIDPKIAKPKGLRKYGFHGLSYAYIVRTVSQYLQNPPSHTNLILLHLGSGASICAIRDGKSLDTSMGLTPASGLPGATRSGDIDPTLIFHYTHRAAKISHDKKGAVDVGVTQAEEILNTKAGWSSLVGSSNFAEITAKLHGPSESSPEVENAKLAFEIFVDRILNYLGAYYLKLGGDVDALVFSGGIGEKSAELRAEVAKRCACLGFVVDEGKNGDVAEKEGEVVEITGTSPGGSEDKKGGKKVLVCRTDEQLEMARECALEPKFWK